jgi:excinuclease ABC subunit C
VKALSGARAEEIAAVPGIGPKLAETVLAALQGAARGGPSGGGPSGSTAQAHGGVEQ